MAPLSETPATFDPEIDPVLFEHALERATEDLRRIVMSITEHYLNSGLTLASTWPALLEIEEQAFSDLAFQSRNEAAVVAALPRIGPTTLPGVNLSGFIDWRLSDLSLPIVYRCVREHLWTASPAVRESGAV
ncbi:MAG: DUF2471 family protein [Burkholderia contaminans]|uniref:DUF2471 domain-containing protein n=1 Tax=Burkholderia aenigmatica TaxID=2015348 RepID=A0A228HYY3_9BURK|nr:MULTISPECIES: DUF2471 family protein [Burkholderia cepacia complex]KVR78788.1 hypothetical protein WK24_31385 [Burkholderia vietnamiensis]KVS20221.1 hypothetical protein WK32_20485 [Burkholderia vietnamiensis]MBR8009374.1 DUF2471 family protein [Burkholderia vietnamiensis]MBR8152017.1 DUF2471 family protein [Burkholderia vietnamiensis]MBR8166015.1 DUF2471 family protein [Burkholderia vietnamiensis]